MRIAGFEHDPGEHCGSTSLRNLARFHGWGYDEPLCFGLGSGLGFTFFSLPDPPERAFVGRPLWLERAFFENLSIPFEEHEGEDWETAWEAVKGHLDAGEPVMVFADLYHLDYYDTETHFAPHSLLLVGYDETIDAREAPHAERDAGTGVVYCSDSEFDEVQMLALSSFREAWSSQASVPLSNRYLVAEGDPERETTAAAREAIGGTCRYMLDPAEAGRPTPEWGAHGVPGIRALASDVEEWTALSNPHWTCRFAYQNIEKRGTGGAAFRGLYVPFLDRVEADVGLGGFADELHEVGRLWSRIAGRWREASETDDVVALPPYLAKVSDELRTVADREERFYTEALDCLR
jgi:hypothetical protein